MIEVRGGAVVNINDISMQRWYALPDDMLGDGWCVMNVPKSPVHSDPAFGELQLARYLDRDMAEKIAGFQNAQLAGLPGRPDRSAPRRIRVAEQDALVFDQIGRAVSEAELSLQAADRLGSTDMGEVARVKDSIRALVDAVNLLTEVAIRARQARHEQD